MRCTLVVNQASCPEKVWQARGLGIVKNCRSQGGLFVAKPLARAGPAFRISPDLARSCAIELDTFLMGADFGGDVQRDLQGTSTFLQGDRWFRTLAN